MRNRPDTHTIKLESNKVYEDLRLDGTNDSETIKGSNIENVVVRWFDITAGYEDGIDCVRGSNYVFDNGTIRASKRTRTFITLKGGIDTVLLKDIELKGKTRYPWDISLGDHTIHNKGALMGQKHIHLRNVWRSDYRPVRVLVMDSQRPVVMSGRVKLIRIPKMLVKVWFKILK